jgi:hypothetical protein
MTTPAIDEVLPGLRAIDWAALDHAYGPATDTPRHLERLLAQSPGTRRDALRALSHSVYHQSGGYTASPYALRALLVLLATPGAPQRAGLCELVCELGIVVGHRHLIATGWVDPMPWLERWYGHDDSTSLDAFVRCVADFHAAAPLFVRLLGEQPASLRSWSAFALTFIPAHRSVSLPRLTEHFQRERHPKVRAAILIAIGILSLGAGAGEREATRAWLKRQRRAEETGPLDAAHAVAMLYLCDQAPGAALVARLDAVVLEEPDLYPFPFYNGDLSALVLDVWVALGLARGWPVADNVRALWRADVDGEQLAARLAVALVESSIAPSRSDDASLSPAERDVLEVLLERPAVFGGVSSTIENTLQRHHLPSSVRELARLLGWLTESEPPPPSFARQLPPGAAAQALPSALCDSGRVDVHRMLCRYYPFHHSLLEEVADLVDWEQVSRNRSVRFDDALLAAFVDRWSFWHLLRNPSTTWPADRIARFADHLSWRALSEREDLPWSEALLAEHEERWDWACLSSNSGLPWSDELIARYKNRWAWHLLSENPALPWSAALLSRYRRWTWEGLSANDGLPWSESFLRSHAHRIDWCQLCKLGRFPWTERFLADHADELACWGHLSANPGLPWSSALVARYGQRWNWNMLSSNPALPWSRELILRFDARWSWHALVRNPAVPWDDPVVLERFAHHAQGVMSHWFREDHHLPWSEALVADPRLQHLFTFEDHRLYARFVAPVFDDALVARALEQRVVIDAEPAHAQLAELARGGRALPLDQPLLAALHISPPLLRLQALSRGQRPLLAAAALRLGLSH